MSDDTLTRSYDAAYRTTAGIQVILDYFTRNGTTTDYSHEEIELAVTGLALCLSQEETKKDAKGNLVRLDLGKMSTKLNISEKSIQDIISFVQKEVLPKIVIPPMTVTPFNKYSVVLGGLSFVNSDRVQQMMSWYQKKNGKMEDILEMLCYYQRIGLGTKHMSTVDKLVYAAFAASMPSLEVIEGCASPLDYIYPRYCSPRSQDVAQFASKGSIFPFLSTLNKPVLLLLNPPHVENFVRVLVLHVAKYLQTYYAQGAAVVYILPSTNKELEFYVSKQKMRVYRIDDGRMIYTTMNMPDISEAFTRVIPKLKFSIVEESCITLDLRSYINSHKQVFIPYDSVATCNNLSSQLAGAITTNRLEYPYVSSFLTSEQVQQLAQNDTSSRFLPQDIRTQWQSDVPDVRIGLGGGYFVITYTDEDYDRIGIITDYFTGKARAEGQLFTNNPPIQGWKKKANLVAQKAVEYSKYQKVPLDTRALSKALYLAKIPMCTNFKIGVAMAIYRIFNSLTLRPGNIDIDTTSAAIGNLVCFDPFGGWGDRAIGASLSGVVSRYICTDSNENLREGYSQIKSFFETIRPNCQITQHITPIEKFDLDSIGTVDLVFSGPPYFNVETYSPCVGQSNIDHPEFNDWMSWFVTQTLRVAVKIRQHGYMVYYLANHEFNITNPLIEALQTSGVVTFVGTLPIIREDYKRRPILLYVWRRL